MIFDEIKLKKILKSKGLTKTHLSNNLGISSRTIAKISKGQDINEGVAQKIINFLGVTAQDLIFTNPLLQTLKTQKQLGISDGIYHETQIKLTYNSNHIEGSQLTEEQTRFIFQTKTIGQVPEGTPIDDVIETSNHFRCVDYIIDNAELPLDEDFIITLQRILKEGTLYSQTFGAGVYKQLPNTVGGLETISPTEVQKEVQKLLFWYNNLKNIDFSAIVEFHYRFEVVHPFQDGNGRVGRLIAFKECLKHNIVPFYIDDANKWFYYRGLREWKSEPNFLIETCLFGQDQYKLLMQKYGVN